MGNGLLTLLSSPIILFLLNCCHRLSMGQSKSKTSIPAHEVPLREKLRLLACMRDCAADLLASTKAVVNSFNVPGPVGQNCPHNVAIGLASYLSVHGTNCMPACEPYGKFLGTMCAGYENISREQTIFQQKVTDKVINPLEKWLRIDYVYISNQILLMRERAKLMDNAAAKAKKNKSTERKIAHELAARELQMQLGVVNVQLAKLEKIRDMHNSYLLVLVESMDDYNERVGKILAQHAK